MHTLLPLIKALAFLMLNLVQVLTLMRSAVYVARRGF